MSATIDDEVIETVKNFANAENDSEEDFVQFYNVMQVARGKPFHQFLLYNDSHLHIIHQSKTHFRKLSVIVDVFTDKICLHEIISYL